MARGYVTWFLNITPLGLSKEVCSLPFLVQLRHRNTAAGMLCIVSVKLGLLRKGRGREVLCTVPILSHSAKAACVGQSWPDQGSAPVKGSNPQHQSVYYRKKRGGNMQFTMYQWELPSEEILLFENKSFWSYSFIESTCTCWIRFYVLLIGKRKWAREHFGCALLHLTPR